ncbi:DUF6093 family protein [Streptomyces sp. NPDC088925]|uniref:DUF6093 family protein n=1 Tax=Streptomyces sp. NPDC088925 TaxID=3365914 RepID=UPI003827734E
MDMETLRADLDALMTGRVRIRRLGQADAVTGDPEYQTVYDGRGALLSTHGQLLVKEILGVDILGESSAWYQLLTPLGAPTALVGDQVHVDEGEFEGRTWYAEATTQVSTTELVRVTRLDEQNGALAAGV